MIDQRMIHELRDNEIIMESFREMTMSQTGKDRLKYTDIVLEAFANPTMQANLLDKLYKDIQKIDEIDFGKIPDSKGDITKYTYYNQMYQCIEVLNSLVEGTTTPNITTMNKLHTILLSLRPDFTFGYRTDNHIIVTTYNLMVASLYEMINICAIDATEYLRAKLSMQLTTPTQKHVRWVTKTANQFIKMYESGQWNILMKTFKSAGKSIVVATEADTAVTHTGLPKLIDDVGNKLADTTKAIKGFSVKDFFKNHPVTGALTALIALFIIIRSGYYYFVHCMGKLSDRLKNITTILRANIAAENSPTAVEKQRKWLARLENMTDTIDYKIVKSEQLASTEMNKANKAEFNPQEISNISGADFEI